MSERKLNLGCGSVKIEGYENIDLQNGTNAYPLDYIDDNSCDEIRASHLLEHFGYEEAYKVVKDWVSKLKMGAVLKIAVPDFAKIAKGYLEGKEDNFMGYLMGGHIDNNDYHKAIYDENSLTQIMEACGLGLIQGWDDQKDTCHHPISLNLMGTKTGVIKGDTLKEKNVKIKAVMSMPRLCFTDNIFCAHKAFLPLGIDFQKGTGVFWDQVLTGMIEKSLDADYIVTLDYDTIFRQEHVIRLCQHAIEHPELDAIVPVQSKREGDQKLFGLPDDWPVQETETLKPIITGHFGLTIFKTEAFKKLSKPWIWGTPNGNGEWGAGRLDPDIYFWQKFHKEGFKVALAKDVSVGHMQIMCSFPDIEKNGYKPIHCYMNDVNNGQYPDHCIPNVELKK